MDIIVIKLVVLETFQIMLEKRWKTMESLARFKSNKLRKGNVKKK